ncbi:hypothetical protein EV580_1345 [Mycobacterium sp. BK086]|uniref:hypothetical protein n=1 Tax=Mycobacterium sp. BK086 TaxID=2512165 RepID=UPI00105E4DB8|nr:hypothetical protein [Mycobacterium sp. BK086]TDO18162.1 hypothetical protein EV580_1345 [Mycobacterium sp. BK086]
MTPNPLFKTPSPAWVAETDQYRAEAAERLGKLIEVYQELLSDNVGMPALTARAFAVMVQLIIEAVDPNDELSPADGNRLVEVAETLVSAIEKLAAR